MKYPSITIATAVMLFVVTVVVLLVPLAVFSQESMSDPDLIQLHYTVDGDNVTITVKYNGTISLKGFTITIGNETIEIGDLDKGDSITMTIPAKNTSIDKMDISFSIMGLYSVEVEMYVKG